MKKIIVLMMMAMLVIGCQEGEVISEENITIESGIQKSEEVGMLSFESFKELNSFVEEYKEADLLEKAKGFAKQGNYTPLLLVYSLTEEEAGSYNLDKENVAKVNTQNSMLLFLLNKNGEIAIEGKIFRIDGDFVYSYTSGNGNDVDTFEEEYSKGGIKIKEEGTYKYGKDLSVYKHTNYVTEKDASLAGRMTQSGYNYINNNLRLRGIQFDEYWWFISFIGSATIVEKKVQILFWSQWVPTASENRLNYDMGYQVDFVSGGPSLNLITGDDVYQNTSILLRVYRWSFGFPAPERYTPSFGGSLHDTYWGTSPTGNFYDVFLSY